MRARDVAARACRRLAAALDDESPADPVDYERIEAIVRQVGDEIYARRWRMRHLLWTESAHESARFVRENIPLHLGKTHGALRWDAVHAAPEDGLFLEFGVWKGVWMRQMATWRPLHFYGFDSFEGLPEPWSTYTADHFDMGGELPPVPPNVTLVKGWFNETLPAFLDEHPEPVSFVHLDCDLYSSSTTVLDLLTDRFRPGSQIVLDDFMFAPGWQQEEHRAFFEWIRRSGWRFEYTGYSDESPACSAAVTLVERGPPAP